MTNTDSTYGSPIEVWLRQKNLIVYCTVVREDETTVELEIDSMSVRGAQREITSFLINDGYAPVGRWKVEASNGDRPVETSRRFRIGGGEDR